MKTPAVILACLAPAACQSVPNVQTPMLLQDKPMIVVRHDGGLQDGACPMWVKIDGVTKGQIERSQTLAIDVEPGIRTVSLGRGANGTIWSPNNLHRKPRLQSARDEGYRSSEQAGSAGVRNGWRRKALDSDRGTLPGTDSDARPRRRSELRPTRPSGVVKLRNGDTRMGKLAVIRTQPQTRPMPDSLQDLSAQLDSVAKACYWKQFHSPKNLAAAPVVEASELLELFQWLTEEQSRQPAPEKKTEVAGELLYLIQVSDMLDTNLVDAACTNLQANELRYPIALSKGNSRGRRCSSNRQSHSWGFPVGLLPLPTKAGALHDLTPKSANRA